MLPRRQARGHQLVPRLGHAVHKSGEIDVQGADDQWVVIKVQQGRPSAQGHGPVNDHASHQALNHPWDAFGQAGCEQHAHHRCQANQQRGPLPQLGSTEPLPDIHICGDCKPFGQLAQNNDHIYPNEVAAYHGVGHVFDQLTQAQDPKGELNQAAEQGDQKQTQNHSGCIVTKLHHLQGQGGQHGRRRGTGRRYQTGRATKDGGHQAQGRRPHHAGHRALRAKGAAQG